MTSVHQLLRRYDLEPYKELGQHFLVNRGVLAQIVAAAELTPQRPVLEIGAGLGTLTQALAEKAGRVVAVELDRRMIPVLQAELSDFSHVQIVQGNILTLDPATLMEGADYDVVANLPYSITSAVLRHLLEASLPPSRMVVTVQREVAERIVARDGRMSLLAISVHFYGDPQLLFRIKPGSFYPPPEVESAVIRIDRREETPVARKEADRFFHIVRAGFSQRRKQLRNSLSAGLQLDSDDVAEAMRAAGLDPRRRAERLRLEDWARLMQTLAPHLK